MTELEMKDFDEWYDTKYNIPYQSLQPRVSREDAKEIWEASLNVVKGQMIKAFIPGL
jgi:hypothetical protein